MEDGVAKLDGFNDSKEMREYFKPNIKPKDEIQVIEWKYPLMPQGVQAPYCVGDMYINAIYPNTKHVSNKFYLTKDGTTAGMINFLTRREAGRLIVHHKTKEVKKQ